MYILQLVKLFQLFVQLWPYTYLHLGLWSNDDVYETAPKFNHPRYMFFFNILLIFQCSFLRELLLFPHLHFIPLNINILEPSTLGFALSRSVNRLKHLDANHIITLCFFAFVCVAGKVDV